MTPLCGMTPDELSVFIKDYGFEKDHANKIATAFYRRGIRDFLSITAVRKELRDLLVSNFSPAITVPLLSETSADRSVKYLFRTESGKEYETVYIPDEKRKTVCVSSQSGCRMGCPFCYTASYGFRGDLTAGEIVGQIMALPAAKEITHVVFMGMGEPMDNLPEVLKACNILTSDWGLAISPRNITVSSVGITPAIKEFLNISDCNLTVSLYSPFTCERTEVVPAEKAFPVRDIIEMMRTFPIAKKRRLSLAYVMIESVNDSDYHLEELKSLLRGSSLRVNLLSYHSIPDDTHKSSPPARMAFFKHSLVVSGISASIRRSRGADISAACGLLASGLKIKH
jgi:23S rRNA (adenine2503-C2)-methyltransferase